MSDLVGEILGHSSQCPKCGRESSVMDDMCGGCGSPLYNRCTKCEHKNSTSAAFCTKCGAPTDYNRLGFVHGTG
jgi:predicted amidophosphoribosyltransferase